MSFEGQVLTLRIGLMKHCTRRRCVWSVSRDQRSPCQCFVHVCDSSDHCHRWSPHVHLKSFLSVVAPSSVGVALILVALMSWLVSMSSAPGQQRHEAFHHQAPFAPFVLLYTVEWRPAPFLPIFNCGCHRRSDRKKVVTIQRVSSTHCSATMSTSLLR